MTIAQCAFCHTAGHTVADCSNIDPEQLEAARHPASTGEAFATFMQDVARELATFDRAWIFTYEYPGYLAHYQELGLEIAMGFDLETGTTWRVDYSRDGRQTGSWAIQNPDHDARSLAARIHAGLNEYDGEDV
jgi:hypothetical protein